MGDVSQYMASDIVTGGAIRSGLTRAGREAAFVAGRLEAMARQGLVAAEQSEYPAFMVWIRVPEHSRNGRRRVGVWVKRR